MSTWVSLFDGHVDVGGVMTPEELARVPAKRGVLALLGEGGKPIILLTAADMRSRLRSRLTAPEDESRTRSADLRTVTRRVLFKLAHSHFETDLHYLHLARAIWPERYASLVAWKPAWFVHVDPGDRIPHFAKTRQLGGAEGQYIGPFASGRDAERFVSLVVEAFDLCRDLCCLRQAPNAQPCAYAQMGRCDSPCDGSVSMDVYRAKVGEALAFACGRRDAVRRALTDRMRAAAEELAFERAAGVKARLARLAEFEAGAFAHARAQGELDFIIVQPGGSVRRAAAFGARGGVVFPAGMLDYPLEDTQIKALLQRMARRRTDRPPGRFERLATGLVVRYLFSSPQRRGLMVRWTESMTPDELARAIRNEAALLKLRAPKPKKPRGARGASPAPSADTSGDTGPPVG